MLLILLVHKCPLDQLNVLIFYLELKEILGKKDVDEREKNEKKMVADMNIIEMASISSVK
jgi:hypothetical protein